jgi:hypothetical protein
MKKEFQAAAVLVSITVEHSENLLSDDLSKNSPALNPPSEQIFAQPPADAGFLIIVDDPYTLLRKNQNEHSRNEYIYNKQHLR